MKTGTSNSIHLIAAVILAAILNSCARPASEEQYVNDREVDAYGQYVFEVDLSEPLRSYDLSLGVNLTCDDQEFTRFDHLPLHIVWQSPTDSLYEEDVFLNRDCHIGGDFHTKQLMSLYRKELIPKERGIWNIKVSVPDSCAYSDELQGVALRLLRN